MIISVVQVQQWWSEWHLRFVVLISLIIQYILVSYSPLNRKFHLALWFKLCIRIVYIASEAVPINALATLLDRQKKSSQSPSVHGNRDLELLWAPILLMHLGGSNAVPIQNMEENEQWIKHLGVAVSQVSVALYVFYLSWPSSSADKRQLAAAILVFIPGILKCFVKPWSVKSGSFSSLQQVSSRSPGLGRNRQVSSSSSSIDETEAYVQAARIVLDAPADPPLGDKQIHSFSERLETLFRSLCVDHTYPHADRLAVLKSFWLLDTKGKHSAVGSGLSHIYNLFYTKHDKTSRYTQILNVALPLAAICLFHASLHGKSSSSSSSSSSHYSPQDVKVTYALFYGTLALEIFSLCYWIMSIQSGWQGVVVLQQNLIGVLSLHTRHAVFLRMLRFLGFDKYLYVLPISSSKDINRAVCEHLRDGWVHCIKDAESYSKFNDSCGELTLEREGCQGLRSWISGRPFDERILIWHLTTDLCFHHYPMVMMTRSATASHNSYKQAGLSLIISNYMVHLLFTNPEMLMIGSRKEIFMIAYQELEELFQQDGYKHYSHGAELRRRILASFEAEHSEQGFLWDACELMKTLLMEINDEDKLWRVIQGVWVEMLCFSAGRCRGYLHAKNIGVEYLSQVWLLLAYAGMQTLPERLQRTSKFQGSLQQEETTEAQDGGIAPSASLQGEGTAASGIKIVVSP